MISIRASAITLLLSLGAAAPLTAQTVVGRLVEEGSGRAIPGAFIVLIDDAGTRHGGVLTGDDGRFTLRAPAAGRYRLRADRIGHESTLSPPIALAAGESVDYRMTSRIEPIELSGITVSSEPRCEVRPDSGLETARLWEEARKALQVAAWADEEEVFFYDVARYERELDPTSLRVRGESVRPGGGYSRNPFVTLPAAELAEHGYVQERDGGRYFYGPDASVLLSDEFLDDHCFELSEAPDSLAAMVGLAFEPVRRRDLPDIRGVLWLDTATAELHSVEYAYTGLPRDIGTDRLGGRLEFEQLPSGAWVVRRWYIRMPIIGIGSRSEIPGGTQYRALAGIKEEGGEILEIRISNERSLMTADRAAIEGSVYDSLGAAPLAGADVFLSGTPYTTKTDAAGRFRLDGLPGGDYSISFFHPVLQHNGIFAAPKEISLTEGEATTIALATPSRATFLAAACAERPADEPGIVVGSVRDAQTSRPIADAEVTLRWSLASNPARKRSVTAERWGHLSVRTDAAGNYSACGLPDGVDMRAWALARDVRTDTAAFHLTEGRIHTQDFRLMIARPARILGHVIDFRTEKPIPGVVLRVGDLEQVTDSAGAFLFAAVAPGSQPLAIEHLTYGEHADTLDVAEGKTLDLTVRLATNAFTLEDLVVTAGANPDIAMRDAGTRADILSRAEIEPLLERARNAAELIRWANIPGLSVRETRLGSASGPKGVCIEIGRYRNNSQALDCNMVAVYLDDVALPNPAEFLLDIDPEMIDRMQLLSPLEAGVRYGDSKYGVLLIYTRGRSR